MSMKTEIQEEPKQLVVTLVIDQHWKSIQGSIEHLTKELLRHDESPRIVSRRFSDFDIKYRTELICSLITLRERLCDEIERQKK